MNLLFYCVKRKSFKRLNYGCKTDFENRSRARCSEMTYTRMQ